MYGYQAGKDEGWNELVDWGQHIYTIDTMYKIENYISDLLCCTVETNNIVKKRLYSKIF